MGTFLTKAVFEVLVKHLVNIEEEKEKLLERYFPETTEEREAFKDLINNYIEGVEKYLSNAEVENTAKEAFPFVVIGSIVEVEDLQYCEVDKYQIISPFECKFNLDMDFASYLSPMGRALLLKKLNDTVTVETPAGTATYIIKAIDFLRELFPFIEEDKLEA